MPATGGSAGSYGRLIVTPDMEPPDASHWDAQEQAYRAGATTWDGIHQKIVVDNAAFRDAADSRGFDEAHRAGAVLAEEAKTIAEWHDKVANKCADIATVLRDTRAGQEQLIREADPKIAAAKLPGEAEALVAQYHGIARYQTEAGVAAAMAAHTSFKTGSESVRALDLLTRWGDVPASPPVQPLDDPSPGIEQVDNPKKTPLQDAEDNPKRTPLQEGSDAPATPDAPTDKAGTSVTQPGVSPGVDAGAGKAGVGDEGLAASSPVTQPGMTPAPRPAAASPLGGAGAPSMGGLGSGGGGMGSGGGIPKMPGGLGSGGMPGAGSNPLSSGLGQMPGAGSGLPNAGGVPGSSAGAGSSVSPLSAFNQGAAATAGMGGGIPPAPPPAPASPSSALSAGGGVHAAPAAAAPGGGISPGAAQPGAVAPAAPASAPAGAGVGTGGGAPMMLPPGSMGPPAAAVPPPAPTMPAGTVGSTNAPAAPVAPSAAGAAASPTLIPASVVAAGQLAAAQERRESADAAAAKELAYKLQHAAQEIEYPIEWAVGVFRSPSGTETVITSNDGASYIPAGVFIPRSVRVLSTDPLVDDHFRQLWFGWGDPARVLIEYAKLRAETGWRLVAAATTSVVNVLRDAGIEHPPSCTRQTNPWRQEGVEIPAPVLDDMHEHRLAVLWPDVYPRLLRVMTADPIFQDRIVRGVSASLVHSATTQAQALDDGIHDAIRRVWMARGADREPTVQQWAEYDAEAKSFNATTSIFRPGFVNGSTADPADTLQERALYRAHWLVARTAEHIGGWARRPLPLPDMCYAAAATGELPHLRDAIVKALVSVEEDLQYEAT
ncbi:hypothetical protein [Mycobacteroides abscessus]|uniref:hypothetical protein n=1 Tax=Mycobacteroides abscessus TaxID=36809 RepID=UPI0009A70317|nr:hypothetical protein [Mycobacteroides abscessus]SLE17991.1 putative methyl-accepting chemotaxis sensory transducer [Mycobacteroides abscessus subsp. massiliense]SLE26396.1 putative methyl-accepting chemotaxis sensory transducer [Mycobacteroides abscessus subsp. massiliense]